MKRKERNYTGPVINFKRDVVILERRIKLGYPIITREIDDIRNELARNRKFSLLRFFDKRIGIYYKTLNPERKNISVPFTPQEIIIEQKSTITCKASDFKFFKNEIRFGEYTLKTQRAFNISPDILNKIPGDFEIRTLEGNKFYFENQGLTRLLGLIEDYCFSQMDELCLSWIGNKIATIDKSNRRTLEFKIKDFEYQEESGRYEIKDNAVNCSVLSKDSLQYAFKIFILNIPKIPRIYKDDYINKSPYVKHVDLFNKEYSESLTKILRKYIYYTKDDIEVLKWDFPIYRSPARVCYRFLDTVVTGSNICEYIKAPSFAYSQKIDMYITGGPKGSLYQLDNNTISIIEKNIEQLKDNEFYDLFKINLQSITEKRNIFSNKEKYIKGYSYRSDYFGNPEYSYDVECPLLNIADKHYLLGHSHIENYIDLLEKGYIDKIAYFEDPNYVCSQKNPSWEGVDCYILSNDENVILYALDPSKSTYNFKVKKGYRDAAIFLIWSYFSSRIYNKRQWRMIDITQFFSLFGIISYDRTSPIKKNAQGIYQFLLPESLYNYIH